MPEPVGVRSKAHGSNTLHRYDEHDSGGPKPACNQPSRATHHADDPENGWRTVDPVTDRTLQWRDLCIHCFEGLKGGVRCDCGHELDRRATTVEQGRYRLAFDCPGCGAAGVMTFDAESGDLVRAAGRAFADRSVQHRLAEGMSR